MPVPIAMKNDLYNVGTQLAALGALVKAIKTSSTAPAPPASLTSINNYLADACQVLTVANNVGTLTIAQRHQIGNDFQGIANELLK